MSAQAVVQIVGAPVAACGEEVKDTWRDLAEWTAGQLTARFGPAVRVEYLDLFESNCPPLPTGTHLPVVLVNGQVLTSGGKLSVPAIRKRLEELGIAPADHRV